jgi:asparagine synthase (glutamine-hydrolysing)
MNSNLKTSINISKDSDWELISNEFVEIYYKGYILDGIWNDIFEAVNTVKISSDAAKTLPSLIGSIRGHFGIIIKTPIWSFAAADKVSTIPVHYYKQDNKVIISNSAVYFEKGKHLVNVNTESVLEMSMAGYTVNGKTLYNEVFQLTAGEYIFVDSSDFFKEKYYVYSPWKNTAQDERALKYKLKDVLLDALKMMLDSVKGREIVVPLSAGYDSRLVVSGLKEVGAENVHCISYGLPGNFESRAAKKIAEKLGYKWTFVPLDLKIQKRVFLSDDFKQYLVYSDNLSNTPVLIDFAAISYLKKNKLITDDAIFVNGNTGDFISGGHISAYVSSGEVNNIESMAGLFIHKHYSLWESLKTKNNIKCLNNSIVASANELLKTNNVTNKELWTIFESLEWSGRQSMLVTSTQRSYEYFGFSWRLPLWDPVLMDFWEKIPFQHKVSQNLYKELLVELNWGNVWHDIELNNYSSPRKSISLVRAIIKPFFIFIGKDKWHAFDKKYFSYFMDITAATAIVPYSKILRDRCGARNRNSWAVGQYLQRKGLSIEDIGL